MPGWTAIEDKIKITPERVCKVLEGMYLLDLQYDDKFADKVYMWCHIARGTCKNPHEDWQNDFLEAEQAVLEALKPPAERNKIEEAYCDNAKSQIYDSKFGDNRLCECGHVYYRHFDPFEDMRNVGCKYCDCVHFSEVSNDKNTNENCSTETSE